MRNNHQPVAGAEALLAWLQRLKATLQFAAAGSAAGISQTQMQILVNRLRADDFDARALPAMAATVARVQRAARIKYERLWGAPAGGRVEHVAVCDAIMPGAPRVPRPLHVVRRPLHDVLTTLLLNPRVTDMRRVHRLPAVATPAPPSREPWFGAHMAAMARGPATRTHASDAARTLLLPFAVGWNDTPPGLSGNVSLSPVYVKLLCCPPELSQLPEAQALLAIKSAWRRLWPTLHCAVTFAVAGCSTASSACWWTSLSSCPQRASPSRASRTPMAAGTACTLAWQRCIWTTPPRRRSFAWSSRGATCAPWVPNAWGTLCRRSLPTAAPACEGALLGSRAAVAN
jgi:hypothetical protein